MSKEEQWGLFYWQNLNKHFFLLFLIGAISNALITIQKLEQGDKVKEQEVIELKNIYEILQNRDLLQSKLNLGDPELEELQKSLDLEIFKKITNNIRDKREEISKENYEALKDGLLILADILFNEIYKVEVPFHAV